MFNLRGFGGLVIIVGLVVGVAYLVNGVWVYLGYGPEFAFVSPKIVSISSSNEAVISYSAAKRALDVKAQVNANGFTTSDYNVSAVLIDAQGGSSSTAHTAITTTPGNSGDIVSATIVPPAGYSFVSKWVALRVTWSGEFKWIASLPSGTFHKTALIKYPALSLKSQGSIKQGTGSITAYLSSPLDFPVKISLTPTNLSLSTTSFTMARNTTSGPSVTALPIPPHCPPNPVLGPPSCAYNGHVVASASPDTPGEPAFASADGCWDIDCIP